MSVLSGCFSLPSHPCITRMELMRTVCENGTEKQKSIGCVCGMIFTDCPDTRLEVEGHTAPSTRLTAFCRKPEKLLPGDILICSGEQYIIRAVTSDTGVLSAVVERRNA